MGEIRCTGLTGSMRFFDPHSVAAFLESLSSLKLEP